MFNKVILAGRLCRDPELRFTSAGKAVCGFRLAVDRKFGKDKETDFIDCVVWEKQAESCAQHLEKGNRALVSGRLQMRQYDAKDGTKRTVYEVVCTSVTFIDYSDKGGGKPQESGGGFDPAGDEPGF